MNSLDKEQVNQRIIEVCEHYLGPGRGSGERRTWACPQCGKKDFHVNAGRRIGGCFGAGCPVPGTTDAIGLIGYFEGLGDYGREFLERLEKGYELLGLQGHSEETVGGSERHRSSTTAQQQTHVRGEEAGGASSHADTRQKMRWMAGKGPPEAPPAGAEGEQPVNGSAQAPEKPTRRVRTQPLEAYVEGPDGRWEPAEVVSVEEVDEESYRRETADAVYRKILELCPIEERDLEFWKSRGISAETVKQGRFGSFTNQRRRNLLDQVGQEFPEEDLLCVGGFYKTEQGQLGFNLRGDYTLIPYHDASGLVTTIEGRVPGEPGEGEAKYKALLDSGSHLYVFPEYRPREIVAVCEGAIGAIVAAQSGIPVASIKGFRTYRCWTDEGYKSLPELQGVDFGGRRVVYVPDVDVKPHVRTEVESEAPSACEWLISRQNGHPALARLPEGYKDLDEWLLSVPAGERAEAFAELAHQAVSPRKWLEQTREAGRVARGSPGDASPTPSGAAPSPQPTAPSHPLDGTDEEDTTKLPVAGNRTLEKEDDTTELPTIGAEGARTQSETGTPAPAAPESETRKQGGSADEPAQPDTHELQLPLDSMANGAHCIADQDTSSTHPPEERTERGKPKGGKTEAGTPVFMEQLQFEDTGSSAPAPPQNPSVGEDARYGSTERGSSTEQGSETSATRSPTDGSKGKPSPASGTTTPEDEAGEKLRKPMRESQAKWYRTLERTPRYRPPEERQQRSASKPERPPTDHIRPACATWAEVVVAVFVFAMACAGIWFAGERMWAAEVLSSPLGWFGEQTRLTIYAFVASGAGYGIWLASYARRRRMLIEHLTGTKRKR